MMLCLRCLAAAMTCTLRLRNKAFYIKNAVGITDYKPDASGGVHVAWGADYAAAWKAVCKALAWEGS